MFWLGAIIPAGSAAAAYTDVGLWQMTLVLVAFCYGRGFESLEPLWRGLAVGLSISSAVAIAQAFGWAAIPFQTNDPPRPAGLLFNPALQSYAIALVSLSLADKRNWLYLPAMLPGLVLAHSRGGWLVLAIGLAARIINGYAAAVTLVISGVAAIYFAGMSDQLRLATWKTSYENLKLFGNGAGAFANVTFSIPDVGMVYPVHVHNDYLELAYEYGILALIPYLVIGAALCRTRRPDWHVFVGYCALATFYFPLYCAPLAFLGSALAGHLLAKDTTTR
jgi:hypothetical protein